MNSNLKKNFIWNIIGTIFSSFNSLFFMIIVTRINGINDAGIFTFAFSTACLFYVIGVYSGRTYQVTEKSKKITDSDYFYSKLITCSIMLIVGILFCLIKGYSFYKSSIILLLVIYKLLEAFSEYIYAILQKNNNLYKTGQSLFLKAITSLLLFLLIDLVTKNLIVSELMIIIGNLIYILLFDIKEAKKEKLKIEEIDYKKTKEILVKGFYTFGFTFLTLYVINAQKYTIDGILSDKLQTIFGIIIMPATILILFGQFIIQPFLITMKKTLNQNKNEFKKMVFKISGIIFVIGLFSIAGAKLCGIPILEILYGVDLKKYQNHLLLIILGATFYGMTTAFSTALTTMRNTKEQLVIFIFITIFTFIISKIFISNYSLIGASFAYLLTMFTMLIIYIIVYLVLIKKYKGDKNE